MKKFNDVSENIQKFRDVPEPFSTQQSRKNILFLKEVLSSQEGTPLLLFKLCCKVNINTVLLLVQFFFFLVYRENFISEFYSLFVFSSSLSLFIYPVA
jgi:hypothetical protein